MVIMEMIVQNLASDDILLLMIYDPGTGTRNCCILEHLWGTILNFKQQIHNS